MNFFRELNLGEIFVIIGFLLIVVSMISSIVMAIDIISEQYQKSIDIQQHSKLLK